MSPHLTLFALALTGCPTDTHFDTGEVLPDLALEDVNPGSPSYGSFVASSFFRGQASAWYFGHAS